MDLVRFELTTSSMPFKKYQSVTDILRKNKGLNERLLGRPVDATRLDFTPGVACGALVRARLQAVVIVVCWSRRQMISL